MAKKLISISQFIPKQGKLRWLSLLVPLFDRLAGITALDRFYQGYQFKGLSPQAFTQRFIDTLQLDIQVKGQTFDALPKSGPAIVVANHPFGGLEGVVLAHLLQKQRPVLRY